MSLSVINNKGGTSKTTTAINLAAALAIKGRRVAEEIIKRQGGKNEQ